MIKFKKINKKLFSKLTAFTLATTLTATILPQKEVKAEENICTMYEEMINYNTENGNFIVKKYYDNTIEVIQENTANKLTISNKGKVELITDNGNSCKKENFEIKNFDAGNLDIDESCIKDKDLKKCTKAIEKYFNSNTYNTENHLEKYKDGITYDSTYGLDYEKIEVESKNQYNDAYLQFVNDLYNNGTNIKTLNANAIALPVSFVGSLASSSATELGVISALSSTQVHLFIVALVASLAIDYAIEDSKVINLDDIYDENIQAVILNAIPANTVTFDDALEDILRNFNDFNPDNDYYRSYLVSTQNTVMLFIDVFNPISKVEAQNIMKDDTNNIINIYTLSPKIAKELITSMGQIPGTSGLYPDGAYKAECHAFKNSYKAYDATTDLYDINKLIFNPNMKVGVQFWHFHLYTKKYKIINQISLDIDTHLFFGYPMVITPTDVKKYGGSKTDIYVVKQKVQIF